MTTTAGTVAGLLAEHRIVLGVDDVSLPSGDTPLIDGIGRAGRPQRRRRGRRDARRAAARPEDRRPGAAARQGGGRQPGQAGRFQRDHEGLRAERRGGAPPADRGGRHDRRRAARRPGRDERRRPRRARRRRRQRLGPPRASARPPATGASAPATATTAACSSTRARGGRSVAAPTRRCPARPRARSRSRSRRRCATPVAAATAPGPPARGSSACPSDGRRGGGVHAFGVTVGEARLLGPVEVRALAAELDLRPTKRLGQNFVHDANTVRRIVRAADLTPDDVVLEVGPGLGSLTLALLPEVAAVHAVEIDPVLAARAARDGGRARPGAGRAAGRARRRRAPRSAPPIWPVRAPTALGREPALQRRRAGRAAPPRRAARRSGGGS